MTANPNGTTTTKDRNKKVNGLIDHLEGIQDDLGRIHDCDTVLLHLERGRGGLHSTKGKNRRDGKGDYSDLIGLEQRKREELYNKFVARYGDEVVEQV